jgi:hypothetical protein
MVLYGKPQYGSFVPPNEWCNNSVYKIDIPVDVSDIKNIIDSDKYQDTPDMFYDLDLFEFYIENLDERERENSKRIYRLEKKRTNDCLKRLQEECKKQSKR